MKILRAAKVIILDKNDNFLVLYRSDTHPYQPHEPDLPGGVIELAEDTEDGLAREIIEETGLAISPEKLTLIYTLTHDFFGRSVSRFLYAVRIDHEQPVINISWEHERYEWLPFDKLPKFERPYQQGIDYGAKHDLFSGV